MSAPTFLVSIDARNSPSVCGDLPMWSMQYFVDHCASVCLPFFNTRFIVKHVRKN